VEEKGILLLEVDSEECGEVEEGGGGQAAHVGHNKGKRKSGKGIYWEI
jgi:hypothetical protein